MDDERPLPREKFDAIIRGCLAVLTQHGFVCSSSHIDPCVKDIFLDVCFGFFGEVEPEDITREIKRVTGLTQKQLDEITLECASIFARYQVKDTSCGEGLNHIRRTIADLLGHMGFEKPDELCQPTHSRWGCHKKWEEVAQQDGLDGKRVAEIREECKRRWPEHYEE